MAITAWCWLTHRGPGRLEVPIEGRRTPFLDHLRGPLWGPAQGWVYKLGEVIQLKHVKTLRRR